MQSDSSSPTKKNQHKVLEILSVIVALVVICVLLAAGSFVSPAKAGSANKPATTKSNAAAQGSWAAPVNIGVIGIHAVMLYTGNVLFWSYPATVNSSTEPAVLYNPVTGGLTNVDIPVSIGTDGLVNEFFCAGESVLPDGKVLVSGGLSGIPPSEDLGIVQTEIFNPATTSWSPGPNMNYGRWYPTTIAVPNGGVMVISGINAQGTATVGPLEEYTEASNKWSLLGPKANLPANIESYPHVYVTPQGNLLVVGQLQTTRLFSSTTNSWSVLGSMNWGNRVYGSNALMPGLNTVLAIGGRPSSSLCTWAELKTNSCATNTAEIFNMTTNTWTYTGSMQNYRYNANLEVLPDGTYLAIGGNNVLRYASPVEAAELYNPTTGQWTTMASQQEIRGYHSTAVLLPDGRVLSAGSDSNQTGGGIKTGADSEGPYTVEIYSPPYLSNGTRPTITSTPGSVKYGATFTINTPDASTIQTVALIRPSATTHAQDWEQRYLNLSFTVGNGVITATAPANSNIAPPGYYMVDIVNTSGVPAVMPFILVNNTGTGN